MMWTVTVQYQTSVGYCCTSLLWYTHLCTPFQLAAKTNTLHSSEQTLTLSVIPKLAPPHHQEDSTYPSTHFLFPIVRGAPQTRHTPWPALKGRVTMLDPYQPRTAADLDDTPPEPHLIVDVCRSTGSILLFGRTGIGKTRLLWQLACGWAGGRETFGLAPARPLRITMIEADMYRTDFESMIKEYAKVGIIAPPELCWFSRDDDTSYFIDGTFGKRLQAHNDKWNTDLTIFDAIPDMTLGDSDKQESAFRSLRALAAASVNRAYLGVMVQRKGSNQQTAEEEAETIDNMLGSQGWGRQASTVWQMTNVPSLVWVKHRLCAKPRPIVLSRDTAGVFSLRSAGAQGVIWAEAAKGFTSVNELATRVSTLPEYRALQTPYKDRMLRDIISRLVADGKIKPTPS